MCLYWFQISINSELIAWFIPPLRRLCLEIFFIAMFYSFTCLELFPNIFVWTLWHFTKIANQMTPTSLFVPKCKTTTWHGNLDIWMILARRRKFILYTSFFTFLIRNTWPAITFWIRCYCINGVTLAFFSWMINTIRSYKKVIIISEPVSLLGSLEMLPKLN